MKQQQVLHVSFVSNYTKCVGGYEAVRWKSSSDNNVVFLIPVETCVFKSLQTLEMQFMSDSQLTRKGQMLRLHVFIYAFHSHIKLHVVIDECKNIASSLFITTVYCLPLLHGLCYLLYLFYT